MTGNSIVAGRHRAARAAGVAIAALRPGQRRTLHRGRASPRRGCHHPRPRGQRARRAERPRARRDLEATAAKVARGGADVVVRINRPWRQTILDLEAAISPQRAGARDHQGGQRGACPAGRRGGERARGRARHAGRHHAIHRDDRDRGGVLPHAGDRRRRPPRRRDDARGRGFRPVGRHAAGRGGLVPAQAAARDRGPRRRRHAARLHRHRRRLQGPQRVPPHRPALAPPRLRWARRWCIRARCRSSTPSSAPAPRRSRPRAGSSPPTRKRPLPAAARSRSTAR